VKKSAMKRCNLGCQQSNENLSGLLAYTEEIREERSWIGRKANLQFKAKFPDPRRRTEKSSARCLLESGPDSAGKARKDLSQKISNSTNLSLVCPSEGAASELPRPIVARAQFDLLAQHLDLREAGHNDQTRCQ
jgi:hypothetical protein